MKVKVLMDFRDKHTREIYRAGEVIEVTNERFAEINGTSHGVFVEKIKKPPKKTKK